MLQIPFIIFVWLFQTYLTPQSDNFINIYDVFEAIKLGAFNESKKTSSIFYDNFLRCKIQLYVRKRERRRRCLRRMGKRRRRPLHRIVFRDLLGPNISLVSSPLIIYEMGVESQAIKFQKNSVVSSPVCWQGYKSHRPLNVEKFIRKILLGRRIQRPT